MLRGLRVLRVLRVLGGFESWECSMSKLSFTALLIHVCIS